MIVENLKKTEGPGWPAIVLAVMLMAIGAVFIASAEDAHSQFGGATAGQNELFPPADVGADNVGALQNSSATIEVVTQPEICDGSRLRFTGVPSGEIRLGNCEPGQPIPRRMISVSDLGPGTKESTLSYIDPAITELGYRLVAIRCDDGQSSRPSTGDLSARKATFRNEARESVTCKFIFSTGPACICPKAGKWRVKNHAGQMACTGAFSMTTPLKAQTGNGTIEVRDGCSTLYAEGMADEAAITFRQTPECGYEGSVGGRQGPIPMTINFTLAAVENSERLTGKLTSTMTQRGMTCNMNRTYELDFISQ